MLTKAVKWLALVVVLLAMMMSVGVVGAQEIPTPSPSPMLEEGEEVEAPVVVDVTPEEEATATPGFIRQIVDDALERARGISPEVAVVMVLVSVVGILIVAVPGMILIYRSVPPVVVQSIAPGINQGLLDAGAKLAERQQAILNNATTDDDWIAGVIGVLANTTDEQRQKLAAEAEARGVTISVGVRGG